jgi:hypothetical protein
VGSDPTSSLWTMAITLLKSHMPARKSLRSFISEWLNERKADA